MARARNIKPAFFLNTDLSEVCALSRLAFIGMWTISDFKGCIELNFKKIKAQILPYDNIDMELITINLEQYGFIQTYSVQGKRYLKILNFEKHQNPHKNEREAGSNIPDIDKNDNSFNNISKNHDKDGTNLDNNGTARADSLILIPSTLKPESLVTAKPKKNKSDLNYSDYPEFEEFWLNYKNKSSKYKALEAWVKSKPPIQQIINALHWQNKTPKWQEKNGSFIPHAATYINDKRWQDEPEIEENPF